MKKLYFLILCAAAILLAGCNGNDPGNNRKYDTKVYITGFRYYSVPYNGTNYKVRYEGSSIIESAPFIIETNYTEALYNTNLPGRHMLPNPILMYELFDILKYDYFTCTVYYYSKSKPQGTVCLSKKMNIDWGSDNYQKYAVDEIIFTSDDAKTKVGVLFEYL